MNEKLRAKDRRRNRRWVFKGFWNQRPGSSAIMGKRSMWALKAPFTRKRTTSPCAEILRNWRPSMKKRPGRRGVAPQFQSLTSAELMRPRFSSLWAFVGRQITCSRRTRVLQPLKATTRLGGNCCTVYDLEMTWKVYGNVESWLGTHQVASVQIVGRPESCQV